MIEKICLHSVKDDPAMICVENYFNCLNKTFSENGFDCPKNMDKAKMQAFLSSRKEPELRLGTAAQNGIFPLENENFNDIKEMMKLMIKY